MFVRARFFPHTSPKTSGGHFRPKILNDPSLGELEGRAQFHNATLFLSEVPEHIAKSVLI